MGRQQKSPGYDVRAEGWSLTFTTITINARQHHGRLLVEVGDDGVGGADPDGSGLRGLADRVAAIDGRLDVYSPLGEGTQITAEFPCAS